MAQTITPPRLNALRRITDGPGTATASRLLAATSLDGLWHFEHQLDEAGQLWHATYLPTGQVQVFPSLKRAQEWTQTPGALPLLRQAAVDDFRAATTDTARAQAFRVVAIHDGDLVAGTDPQSRCECGGYLAYIAGKWTHADVCSECWSPDGRITPCPDGGEEHIACAGCAGPEPVQCQHNHCIKANDLTALPCEGTRSACCGCCHGEA